MPMLRVVVTGLQERFAAIIKAGPLQCRRLLRAVPAGGVFLRTNGMVGDAVGTVAIFKRIDRTWRQGGGSGICHCKTPGDFLVIGVKLGKLPHLLRHIVGRVLIKVFISSAVAGHKLLLGIRLRHSGLRCRQNGAGFGQNLGLVGFVDVPGQRRNQQGGQHGKDAFLIRRSAIETGVHCLTAIDTARALVESLENADHQHLTLVDIAKL